MDLDAFSVIRYVAWGLGFLLLVIFTQDLQVFPAVIFSALKRKGRRNSPVPLEVESTFVDTSDGKRLEVWRVDAAPDIEAKPFVALIFHGNAGNVENFFALQLWFHYLGIVSYAFDYRGTGHSTGWPSEKGIALDSDAFFEHVIKREGVRPDQLIVFGFSVGGAPAARIAAVHEPKLLILMSAFTGAKRVLRETAFMRVFAPFLWWRLSTIDSVSKLRFTSLILAHGDRDRTIPPIHARDLLAAYSGAGHSELLTESKSDHNNLFFTVREELASRMIAALEREVEQRD